MSLQDELFHRAEHAQSRPAVILVLSFIAGILLGSLIDAGAATSLVLLAVPLVLLMLLIRFHRSNLSSVLVLVTFVTLGFTKYQIEMNATSAVPVRTIAEPPRNMLVWGTVVNRPRIGEERTQFIVRTDSLSDGKSTFYVTADLLASVRPDIRFDTGMFTVETGAYVLVHGLIDLPAGRRNPYEPDFNRYLSLNGIDAFLYVRGHYNVERIDGGRSSDLHRRLIEPVRRHVGDVIDRQVPGESGHFLRGLMLGDRSRISDSVRDTFVSVGVIHILAVSGLHVGIVTVIFFSVFGLLRVPRIPRIVMTIGGLILYMFVTGAAPSVVRATIMASIILTGFVLQRKNDIYNSIAVAALILLFNDTRDLFKPSFQLSFAAVLAIVYLYPRFWEAARTCFPRLTDGWFGRPVVQLFLVSMAAQLGTLPFTAYYFERISFIAFAANLIVIPAVTFALSFGFAMCLLGLLSTWLEHVYGSAVYGLLSSVLGLVDLVSRPSFVSMEIYHFGMLHGLLFYAVLGLIVHLNDPARFRTAVFGVLIVMNLFVIRHIVSFDPASRQSMLRMTMLDVGQGDALLLEFPDGKTMLYDAGPRTETHDAGESTVVPFLKRHGIRRLDAVVISHAHADHYGGMSAVVGSIGIGRIYDANYPVTSDWYDSLRIQLEESGIPVYHLYAGDRIDYFEGARIYVLHPAPVFLIDRGELHSNLNNVSIVLLVVYGEVSILLTGDAELEPEWYMGYFYGDFLRATVLKAGHHGSATSSTERFLRLVRPDKALISVGRMNRFNHPGAEVIERFAEGGIAVYRTDRDGAIRVETCGREYSVTTMR
jgi:competence protein ComEC